MITLFAIGSDGWALARKDGKRWLLRPPYGKEHLYPLSPKKAARLLMDGGFELTDREFQGWGELCRYLERQRVDSATPEELEKANVAAERLIRRANPEQAARHLERIESEIDNGRLRACEEALLALLRAPSVQEDNALLDKAVGLLQRIRQRALPIQQDSIQNTWVVRDEARLIWVTQSIARRGAVLFPAAAT